MLGTTAAFDNTSNVWAANALIDSNSSALWGWILADEPNAPADMIRLARARRKLDILRPGHLSFVNLLPNYGMGPPWGVPNVGNLGANQSLAAYEAYIDYFIARYRPQVLCFDHVSTRCRAIPPLSNLHPS